MEPYQVVLDEPECEKCGSGATWGIKDDEGVYLGQSFIEESDAYELCNLLNTVFMRGYIRGGKL